MWRFIGRRLLQLIPTLFGVITLVFFMIALSPGDPARVMLGERASAERLEQLRADLGLDRPLMEQYGMYLSRVVRLDFGESITSGRKVIDEIKDLFPATVELAVTAMLFATVVGVLLGVVAARKKNSLLDSISMTTALVGVSMPVFWLALVMIMFFSVGLGLFPTGGRMNVRLYFQPITNFYILDTLIVFFRTGDISFFLNALHHLVLPSVALGTIPLAIIARVTRSSMLDVLGQDYIKTVRASGVSERTIIFKYALKNTMLPVITVVGIQFGLLLSGAILTETIFAWPGIGRWLYGAIAARDYPSVQGGIIVISTVFVLINLLVDILYTVVNPKVRVS